MNGTLPSLDELKNQAKRLRAALERDGTTVSHSKALEMTAQQYGYRDWNTIHAAVGNRPPGPPVGVGQRVAGTYLGQPFAGEVLAVRTLGTERFKLTIEFDEPVDVVTFDSFSAFRRRVHCTVGRDGVTMEKTSNGDPHMRLALD